MVKSIPKLETQDAIQVTKEFISSSCNKICIARSFQNFMLFSFIRVQVSLMLFFIRMQASNLPLLNQCLPSSLPFSWKIPSAFLPSRSGAASSKSKIPKSLARQYIFFQSFKFLGTKHWMCFFLGGKNRSSVRCFICFSPGFEFCLADDGQTSHFSTKEGVSIGTLRPQALFVDCSDLVEENGEYAAAENYGDDCWVHFVCCLFALEYCAEKFSIHR
jgi:hypothetical protein